MAAAVAREYHCHLPIPLPTTRLTRTRTAMTRLSTQLWKPAMHPPVCAHHAQVAAGAVVSGGDDGSICVWPLLLADADKAVLLL